MSPKMPRFVRLTAGRRLTLSESVQQARSALRLGDGQAQMEEVTFDNRQVNLHGGAGASWDPAARAKGAKVVSQAKRRQWASWKYIIEKTHLERCLGGERKPIILHNGVVLLPKNLN